MKSTKKSLALSVLSLVLCVAMLLGTTFAWFTDSVTSGKNRIVAGNLDVEMYYKNGKMTSYAPVNNAADYTAGNNPFFVNDNGDPILWEPGVCTVTEFKVANVGNLALKYSFITNVEANEVGGHNLTEVIKAAVITDSTVDLSTREAAIAAGTTATWNDITSFAAKGQLAAQGKTFAAETNYKGQDDADEFRVVLYWAPTDDDNLYNMNNLNKDKELYINIDISLTATQIEEESDGFDFHYDALEIAVEQPPFSTVLVDGGEYIVNDPLSFTPVDGDGDGDVTVEDKYHELKLENDTTMNLQNTVSNATNAFSQNCWGQIRVQPGTTLTINANDNGKWLNKRHADTTLEEGDCPNSIINACGGTVIVNGGYFESDTSVFFAYTDNDSTLRNTTITINGGTFIAGEDGVIFDPTKAPTITINGGTFYNWNPSAYVTEGHTVTPTTSGSDTIYTVS